MKTKEERVISLSELEVSELLKEVQNRGYYIAKTPITNSGQTFKGDLKRWNGNVFKFAVVSDTHLCSRYQQLTHLTEFYHVVKRRHIDCVYHIGDLVDGEKVYRGQEYELFVVGADGQTDYAVSHYPQVDGVHTYIIAGNHDLSFMETSGYNVAQAVARQRDDITYLGDYLAYVDIEQIKIAMLHGSGGGSYAKSYKLQKLMETLPSGPEKPNFLFLGHYHNSCILSGYRNIEGIMMPCFQAQTPFESRRSLSPTIAGLIVTIQTDESGLAKVVYEWVPFYKSIKNDF